MNSWRDREDYDEMIGNNENEVLYDNYDRHNREAITRQQLEELPILDATGAVRRVFDINGYEVPRRIPRFLRHTLPLGGLVDFSRVHEMFCAPPDDNEEAEEHRPPSSFHVYPQAGLVSCGHVVANGLLYPFYSLLESINRDLTEAPDNDIMPIVPEWVPRNQPVIAPVSCQMYNSVMHNTRGHSSQHHGVVLGNVTAALAGHWASSTPLAAKASRIQRMCDTKLPHEEYIRKITDRPLSRDLRVENVYAISMSSIHPAKCTGK